MLTSSIARNTVDKLLLAHLENSSVASLAGAIMTAMPRASGPLAYFPPLLSRSHLDDCTDNFVSRYHGECGSEFRIRLLI
jgi:hypothetical protein